MPAALENEDQHGETNRQRDGVPTHKLAVHHPPRLEVFEVNKY